MYMYICIYYYFAIVIGGIVCMIVCVCVWGHGEMESRLWGPNGVSDGPLFVLCFVL